MSVVDAPPTDAPVTLATTRGGGRGRFRLFRSELGMIFRRPRNLVSLVVILAAPVTIAIAVKVSTPSGGDGPQFLNQITQNGIFVSLTALVVTVPFFLPLAISGVAGESVAGEANLGTLRYLLTVPVSRTRLLAVKYAAVAVFCVVATLLISVVGMIIGFILFPEGDATLLSGTQIGLFAMMWRLLLVSLYVGVCMAALGAIGLFLSTLLDYPVGAIAGTVGIAIVSQILDNIPQLDVIESFLISHHWLAFGDLLRDPMATNEVGAGLLSAAAYIALFTSLAWSRLSTKDVSA